MKNLRQSSNANDLTQFKKDENFNWLKEINSQSLLTKFKKFRYC